MSEEQDRYEVEQDAFWQSEVTDKVLEFVDEYKRKYPWSPDVREVAKGVGISSTSVVNYHYDMLEEAGFIAFHYVKSLTGKSSKGARTVHLTDKGRAYLKSVRSHEDGVKP